MKEEKTKSYNILGIVKEMGRILFISFIKIIGWFICKVFFYMLFCIYYYLFVMFFGDKRIDELLV